MATKADELKLDIEELNKFLQQATRPKIQEILNLQIKRLQTDLAKLIQEQTNISVKPSNLPSSSSNRCYEVKLNNYGWDQTKTAVKIYVELKDVHNLPSEAVTCNFTERSLNLSILGLENKNYRLQINNLCEEINAEKSYTKVKTDMVIVYLVKSSPKNWSHITGIEKRIKEAKSQQFSDIQDDPSNPSACLMNLMKKMYQEGDDEMRRSITKALSEVPLECSPDP